MPHTVGKLSMRLQLCNKPHLKFTHKVMGLQNHGTSNFENFKIPTWENNIWVLALWLGIKNIIRGKVLASPSSGHGDTMNLCLSMVRPCTKSAPTTH